MRFHAFSVFLVLIILWTMFVEEYHFLPWTCQYETVLSIDLHFTQTLMGLIEHSTSEAPGRCRGVGWSSGLGLGGSLPRSPEPRGSWAMVHDGPAEQQSPAQPKTQASWCSSGPEGAQAVCKEWAAP